jgi:hypothetical protein
MPEPPLTSWSKTLSCCADAAPDVSSRQALARSGRKAFEEMGMVGGVGQDGG